MSTKNLARFFVRFQAVILIFYGIVAISYFNTYLRPFMTVHANRDLDDVAAINFFTDLFRIVAHFTFAAILFARTDWVISCFVKEETPPVLESKNG